MRCATINSSDLFGPENPGKIISAKFGIFLATFLDPGMDVNARVENLYHYIEQDQWTRVRKEKYNEIWKQPTLDMATRKLCEHFCIQSTPRIEANLREAMQKLAEVYKEQLRREIKSLQERLEIVLRYERP